MGHPKVCQVVETPKFPAIATKFSSPFICIYFSSFYSKLIAPFTPEEFKNSTTVYCTGQLVPLSTGVYQCHQLIKLGLAMKFSRILAEALETLNMTIGAVIIVLGGYFGYRTADWAGENLTFGAGLGLIAGIIAAALICGLIANLSLIEQHLALIADDIEELRACDAAEDEADK